MIDAISPYRNYGFVLGEALGFAVEFLIVNSLVVTMLKSVFYLYTPWDTVLNVMPKFC
jgi:hypothetical protein